MVISSTQVEEIQRLLILLRHLRAVMKGLIRYNRASLTRKSPECSEAFLAPAGVARNDFIEPGTR